VTKSRASSRVLCCRLGFSVIDDVVLSHRSDTVIVAEAEKREIDLFRRFGAFYTYGFYIARVG